MKGKIRYTKYTNMDSDELYYISPFSVEGTLGFSLISESESLKRFERLIELWDRERKERERRNFKFKKTGKRLL